MTALHEKKGGSTLVRAQAVPTENSLLLSVRGVIPGGGGTFRQMIRESLSILTPEYTRGNEHVHQ